MNEESVLAAKLQVVTTRIVQLLTIRVLTAENSRLV